MRVTSHNEGTSHILEHNLNYIMYKYTIMYTHQSNSPYDKYPQPLHQARLHRGVTSALTFKTKRRLLYLKTQFVPRSKRF